MPHRLWPLGALAVALVACGGDDDNTSSTTAEGQPGRSAADAVLFFDWEPSVKGNPELPVPKVVAQERVGRRGLVLADGETPSRYWAVVGRPALAAQDVESAKQDFDPVDNPPVVAITLTDDGRARFQALTRAVARRAKAKGTRQRFAIVVDEKVASRPFVDPRQYPNGFDGRNGIQIVGGFTIAEAKSLADRINAGG